MTRRLTYWEDLAVGSVYETAGRTITELDLLTYAGLSGDWNEIHTNSEFASRSPFGARIAYGPQGIAHAFGLMSRLGLWEGTGLAILGLEWRFLAPIVLHDTIRVRMSVAGKRETSRPERGVIVRGVAVLNQRDDVVQEGQITMLIRRRPVDSTG